MRRLVAAVGVAAAVTVAGCAGPISGTPVAGGQGDAAPGPEGTNPEQETGFEACALLEPEEIAGWIGTDSVYVTSIDVMDHGDAGRNITCTYHPRNVPGLLGMKLTFSADADPEKYFLPFEKNYDNVLPLKIGDRGAAVGYRAKGTVNHFYEIRAIEGNRGLHLFYPFRDDGTGAFPVVEDGARKWGTMLNTAFERMPDTLDIPDGKPEGACAEIDLDHAEEVLGAELTTARTVEGEAGLDCTFGGRAARLLITLLTDPGLVPSVAAKPEDITHDDIGDGARLRINEARPGEQGPLDALANVDGGVVSIQATYGDGVHGVTEPRPDDVELVRAIVSAVSGEDA